MLATTMATLDVVIVNFNSGGDLGVCLESLFAEAAAAADGVFSLQRVVIVDNGSSDDSLARLEDTSHSIILMRNSCNLGFARGCNQGAKGSSADFILFLNPDTKLLPESLSLPLQRFRSPDRQQIGICGIQLVGERGEVTRTCMRFPTPIRFLTRLLGLTWLAPASFPAYGMSDWAHDETREVDAVLGAFFLVRRAVFEALGGFDERYFLYFEEVDFSKRASLAGWRTLYLAEARAHHRGGPSWRRVDPERLFHSGRSRIVYCFTHFAGWTAWGVAAAILVIEPVSRVLSALAHRSGRDALAGLGAYLRLWLAAPGLLPHRLRSSTGNF